jgi:RNA-directed DNA polymerase
MEGRSPGSGCARTSRDEEIGVSLATPEKIRTLQRALYVKAKQEPRRRFHFLYDKVWREDILAYAYACCRANGGAPGVDGETFTRIEEYGVGRWLNALREEVRTGRYTPQPVKRVMIPKPGGAGQRPLGIPTIRDRVVQTAATRVLEPIFEAEMRRRMDTVPSAVRSMRFGRSTRRSMRGTLK